MRVWVLDEPEGMPRQLVILEGNSLPVTALLFSAKHEVFFMKNVFNVFWRKFERRRRAKERERHTLDFFSKACYNRLMKTTAKRKINKEIESR